MDNTARHPGLCHPHSKWTPWKIEKVKTLRRRGFWTCAGDGYWRPPSRPGTPPYSNPYFMWWTFAMLNDREWHKFPTICSKNEVANLFQGRSSGRGERAPSVFLARVRLAARRGAAPSTGWPAAQTKALLNTLSSSLKTLFPTSCSNKSSFTRSSSSSSLKTLFLTSRSNKGSFVHPKLFCPTWGKCVSGSGRRRRWRGRSRARRGRKHQRAGSAHRWHAFHTFFILIINF